VRRLCLGVLILPLLVLAPPIKRAASDPYPIPSPRPTVPEARYLSVSTDHPFLRDRPLLATVSPNGDGYRDFVDFRFFLTAAARIKVQAQTTLRTFQKVAQPTWSVQRRATRGWQTVRWRPSRDIDPTTYAILPDGLVRKTEPSLRTRDARLPRRTRADRPRARDQRRLRQVVVRARRDRSTHGVERRRRPHGPRGGRRRVGGAADRESPRRSGRRRAQSLPVGGKPRQLGDVPITIGAGNRASTSPRSRTRRETSATRR
jgi:hypothetical protein